MSAMTREELDSYVDLHGKDDTIDHLNEGLARLEDLRRWRPMSEKPRKTKAEHDNRYLGRLAINPDYIRPVAYDFEEQEWGHPRHHEEEAWEWTYIPGQEPKESK